MNRSANTILNLLGDKGKVLKEKASGKSGPGVLFNFRLLVFNYVPEACIMYFIWYC
jgi:hypothetical protein